MIYSMITMWRLSCGSAFLLLALMTSSLGTMKRMVVSRLKALTAWQRIWNIRGRTLAASQIQVLTVYAGTQSRKQIPPLPPMLGCLEGELLPTTLPRRKKNGEENWKPTRAAKFVAKSLKMLSMQFSPAQKTLLFIRLCVNTGNFLLNLNSEAKFYNEKIPT